MNNKFIVMNNFGSKPNVCFFGLFDGHHGDSAADLTSMELPVLLLHQLSRLDPSYQMTSEEQKVINSFNTVFSEDYRAIEESFSSKKKRTKGMKSVYENIHKAFAKAFWRMDRLLRLGRREASRVRWSGCSAVTCILESSVESPEARRSWGRISDLAALADRHLFPGMPQITTGVLHIANAGMYIECGRLHLNMFYSWQQNLSCFQNYLLIYYLMTFSCLDISLTSLRNDQQPQFRFRLQAQHEL